MRKVIFSATFKDTVEFAAQNRAYSFLGDAGFSIGRRQAHAPSGILHGKIDIQKWRNLSAHDRDVLHGAMVTCAHRLRTTFEIYDTLTGAALASFRAFLASHHWAGTETYAHDFQANPRLSAFSPTYGAKSHA